MKNYKLILFDLDGTLTDPFEGIANSIAYALHKFDIPIADKNELRKFIGPPLIESFGNFCGFSDEQARLALSYYREYFREKGMFENSVYDGIEELLEDLPACGIRLCVATSKPEPFAEKILEHFHLAHYFECIAGSELDGTRAKKNEVIEYALQKCNFVDRTKAVMVGDREHDIVGAAKCAVDSVGVLFGYGSREELQKAGATYVAATVADIKKVII